MICFENGDIDTRELTNLYQHSKLCSNSKIVKFFLKKAKNLKNIKKEISPFSLDRIYICITSSPDTFLFLFFFFYPAVL